MATEHKPVFWTMGLDDGWYAYLDDERIGPFASKAEALRAAADQGWPVED